MSDLGLTKEEREYAERIAREESDMKGRLGFYAIFGVPMLAFAIYGFVKRDFVAEFIAFAGIFFFLAWWISQESKYMRTYKSLFRKVAEHEKKNGGA